MSGAIGRQYLIQTWNGASEYSGEMIGNRQRQSTQMYLPNGKANIEAFKEEEPKKKGKEVPLEYKVFPQQRTFDRWEALEKEVEDAFLNGGIDPDQYQEKMAHILQKKDRAWFLLCKAKGWTEELEEYEIKKDIEKLGKQIEKQKEKNAREALRMQARASRVQRRRPRGKAQSSGFTWIVVSVLAFIFVF